MKKELTDKKNAKVEKTTEKAKKAKEIAVTKEVATKDVTTKEVATKDVTTKDVTTKDVTTSSKKTKKLGFKKLPSLFKKKYTKSKFEKKILKRLYVADDKKLITSLFTEQEFGKKKKKFFAIPKDKKFTKKEIVQLKRIAKDIKTQKKGRVKWLPLLILILIIVGVFLGTDLILKIGLQKTMEGIFGAKVSTSYVHLNYLKSSISIKNLVVANKNAPMKNLFQFDSIIFDIDVNRMFEKSFIIDEIEAAGFAIGTDRKFSGALPEKKQKEKKESKPIEMPAFITDLKDSAVSELQKMFASYNPANILNEINSSLKTPAAADAIVKEMNNLIPYWQNMPSIIEKDINSISGDYSKLQKLNVSSITDLQNLQSNLDLITRTINSTKKITDEYKTMFERLDKDTKTVKTLTTNMEKAIQSDKNLATSMTSKLTSITPSSSIKFLSNSVENFLQSVLGAYYPMIKQVLSYVDTVKQYLPEKKEKEVKPKIERLKGETITWGRPKMPTFYVRKAHGSGNGFDFTANEITTNANLSGKPTTLYGTFSVGEREDSFDAKLDLRENHDLPMIEAAYYAPSHPFSFEMVDANTTLEVQVKANDLSNFSLSGFANLTNASFKLPNFEPEFAYNLCNDAVKSIDATYIGVTGSYFENSGLNLSVSTDFDRNFIRAVSNNMGSQINGIKEKALAEVSAKLNEYKDPVDEKLSQFNVYKNQIDGYKKTLDDMIDELNKKKAEFEKSIKDKTGSAIKQGVTDSLKKIF